MIKRNSAKHVMNQRQVMSFDLPTVAEIQLAAERGQRITQDDVSAISQGESALTGRGPSRGGPAGEYDLIFLSASDRSLSKYSNGPESFYAADEFRKQGRRGIAETIERDLARRCRGNPSHRGQGIFVQNSAMSNH